MKILTRTKLWFSLLVVMAPGFSGAAENKSVTLAGRDVTLVAPEGMCFYDRGQLWDMNDLAQQRKLDADTNVTLAGVADCAELEQIRVGRIRRLTRFGYVKSPLPSAGNQPLDVPREDFIAEVGQIYRAQGATLVADAAEQTIEKVEQSRTELKMGGMTNLGIIYQEPDMVGVLLLSHIVQGELTFDRIAAVGFTLVNGIPVVVNLYREYEEPSVIRALTTESKAVMRSVVDLNP
jgi:hypothetical protein